MDVYVTRNDMVFTLCKQLYLPNERNFIFAIATEMKAKKL